MIKVMNEAGISPIKMKPYEKVLHHLSCIVYDC